VNDKLYYRYVIITHNTYTTLDGFSSKLRNYLFPKVAANII